MLQHGRRGLTSFDRGLTTVPTIVKIKNFVTIYNIIIYKRQRKNY